jgi:integrase/recombinase XerD
MVFLRARGHTSLYTVEYTLRLFSVWAEAQGVTTIEQLTLDLMRGYQEELTFRLSESGRPITIATQLRHLYVLRSFTRYLVNYDLLLSDPMKRLQLPRQPKGLPRVIPNASEAIRLMKSPTKKGMNNANDPQSASRLSAFRDQAILEVLYSTGMRRGEVVRLDLSDLDLVGGYVWVREGKGKKDRVVPIGKVACERVQCYLDAVRPSLLNRRESGALFLNQYGGRLSGSGIYQVVKKAVAKANLSQKVTTHSLRHAAATHMLKNGAPIRYLQEFLGHASVETTQVYTRITIPELKAIHAKYHPREKDTE